MGKCNSEETTARYREPTEVFGKELANARVVDAPIAFTQDEVDFYALATSMFGASRMLFTDVENAEDKAVQREFMAHWAKLRAAYKAVKPNEELVKIGRDCYGRDWVLSENLVGTADQEADYVVPYFLMWLMRRVLRGDKGAERERLEQGIQEWQGRIKKLQAELDGLRAENTRLKSDAQAVATVNTGALSRIQSKRGRRIKVSR